MKKTLRLLFLSALTVGLLGSCSKMNERIDSLDQRVGNIENEKIASIENQIAAINSSIADLAVIRQDILDLQVAVGAKGGDISELRTADEILGQRIDDLKAYVGDLSKYAEKDWVTAAFATVAKLNETKTELDTLKGTVDSIDRAISALETRISTLEARVSALEKMIQTVSIIPAYNDGGVKVEDGILTINCIITPKEAVTSLTKENFTVFTDEVLTKAGLYGKLSIAALAIDKTEGSVKIKVDASSAIPAEDSKALAVALNVKNGISDFTTEFVPMTVKCTYIPTGALPGKFTVNKEGKRVLFSQGNLWVDASGDSPVYSFEANQYDAQSIWSTSHISHFYWSKADSVSYAVSYQDDSAAESDVFFTNATTETANANFKVGGVTGMYRVLSNSEWWYLFNDRTMAYGGPTYEDLKASGITVEDVTFKGIVLFPDDFTDQETWKTKYTTWEALNNAGLVFLPNAGNRKGSSIKGVGDLGFYWLSPASDNSCAFRVRFDDHNAYPICVGCDTGGGVRLITDCQ